MNKTNQIKTNQEKLVFRYKLLMEQAYNLRQTDSALSDISEFKAIKLLNKLNRLKYLSREDERRNNFTT
ncbi:MAG: Lacal_2735 family protein [Flavobacteriaceae bacterium]